MLGLDFYLTRVLSGRGNTKFRVVNTEADYAYY